MWSEARSLARVNHPQVCQVFDVLESGDQIFLVLELLKGQALSERLAGGALSAAEAAKICMQILDALSALHAAAIVHRDLKPSNAFLTTHGVKLLDFGIAGNLAADGTGSGGEKTVTSCTAAGVLMGTPQYMAPEQARGEVVGPAADIFAAGCVFYEMLSGKRPFEGESSVEILYSVMHHEAPPLVGSAEIEALDRLIRRAMAKRAEERFASAAEMREAIAAISFESQGAPASQTKAIARLIVLPLRVLKADSETDFLAYSLPDAISGALSGIDSLIVRSSLVASRFTDISDLKKIASEADVDVILAGSILRAGTQIRVTYQLVDAASGSMIWSDTANSTVEDLFKIQDDLSQRIVESLVLPLSDRERRNLHSEIPASAKAYEFYLRANQAAMTRSVENMRVARELYEQCLKRAPDYAPAWARLGRTIRFLDKFGHATDASPGKADDAFRRAFALNPDLAVAHNFYTLVECDTGRAPEAMVRLLKRFQHRPSDPDLFSGLVQAFRYCDKLDASLAAHERALRFDASIKTSVPHTHFMLGDYRRVVEIFEREFSFYLDCAALAALGENKEALRRLRKREAERAVVGAVKGIARSLQAYLEGDIEASLKIIAAAEDEVRGKEPESYYYLARHLAKMNQIESAIRMLHYVLDGGFLFGSSLERDPWFESLRRSSGFAELLQRAQKQGYEAHEMFVAAGGEGFLGV